LKEVCDETGTLLIADEVITGFRLAPGGGQEVLGVKPDLTTFGKTIGGGEFPVGAVGGKRDIMELMDHIKDHIKYILKNRSTLCEEAHMMAIHL